MSCINACRELCTRREIWKARQSRVLCCVVLCCAESLDLWLAGRPGNKDIRKYSGYLASVPSYETTSYLHTYLILNPLLLLLVLILVLVSLYQIAIIDVYIYTSNFVYFVYPFIYLFFFFHLPTVTRQKSWWNCRGTYLPLFRVTPSQANPRQCQRQRQRQAGPSHTTNKHHTHPMQPTRPAGCGPPRVAKQKKNKK